MFILCPFPSRCLCMTVIISLSVFLQHLRKIFPFYHLVPRLPETLILKPILAKNAAVFQINL